ncbi:MAG: hypothetical protein V3S26_03750 [Acidimicrobiia bacterium]
MSTGLLQQLADYGAFHDEEQGYIDVADVFAAGNSVSPSDTSLYAVPRRSNRFGVWVAIAAVVLTVLLIGVIPFLVGNEETPPADTVVPTSLAESTPTTLTESTPTTIGELVLIPGTWSRVLHDEGVFGDKVPFTGGMRDITVGGPGLVAVGEGDDGATVWTSVDGITWSRVPHDEAVFGGGNTMSSVTRGGAGLVAVGGGAGPEHERDSGDAAVWTSVDGITWSRVPHDDSVFGGERQQQMASVVAGGPGLVAVGWDTSGGTPDAAVWTSVDGFTWSRVPHDEAVFGGEGEQMMNSVTVGGPGLVAVGSAGFLEFDKGQLTDYDDFTGVAAVWTSVDGLTWSRVSNDDAVFGGEGNQWMNDVTTAGAALVAVGGDWSSAAHHAAVWTSVDGITWSRVPNDEAIFGGEEHDQLMLSVTPAGSALVVVGRAWAQSGGDHSEGSDDSAASVWTSDDGATWSWFGFDEAVFGSEDNSSFLLSDGPVFTEYRQFMSGVTATASGVVAVGADWSGPSHGAAVWMVVSEAD